MPFIGHIGICREDGVILDFAGPNFVSVDNFAFGAVTRYIQLNGDEVCTLCFILIFTEHSNLDSYYCSQAVNLLSHAVL